jgi:hypothetical protein
MLQQILNYRPNQILIGAIIVAILFFVFVMPNIEKYNNIDNKKFKEHLENVLDNGPPVKIDTNKCAKSCCLRTEWALPPELQSNDVSKEELKNYIPSNFSCNFGSKNGSGCVCYTKEDANYLTNKGGNI